MNIVIINDNARINGGATKIAILNARDLADSGHMVYFFTAVLPVGPELESHPRIRVICSEQYEILADPNRIRAFAQGWWNPKAQQMARALFASLDSQSTVVHLHLWAKALSSSVAREAIRAGFPVICTLHDFLLACPTGTLFHHRDQAVCRRAPMSASCVTCNCDTRNYGHKLWRVGRQVVQKQLGLLPNQVYSFVAHSTLVAQVMKPYLPSGAVVHHVPAYIESTQEARAKAEENETFVYVGRFVREKGVLLLARASRTEKIPVTFVGTGELAAEISVLNPNAKMTGWLDHSQTIGELRKSRALVFPSLWYETLGLVVLEAAAIGIPSIVPDASAAAELVIDGVTGLHFKIGDEQDLREKMSRLKDPDLAESLGRAAYKHFWNSTLGSRTAHIRALESIYRSTLELNHAGQHRTSTVTVERTA